MLWVTVLSSLLMKISLVTLYPVLFLSFSSLTHRNTHIYKYTVEVYEILNERDMFWFLY